MNNTKKFAALFPIIAGAGWGIVGVFSRELIKAGFDNPTIVFSRTAMCTIIVGLMLLVTDRSKLKINIKDIPVIAAIALVGSVLLMVAYNMAAVELSLSLTAVLLATAPIFVLGISAVLFHEKLTKKKIACAIFAFIGCVMLSGVLESNAAIHWSYWGLLMGVAAAAFNAIYILLSKLIAVRGYSSLTICFYIALFATIMVAPITDYGVMGDYIAAKPVEGTAMLLLQSIITSVAPSILYVLAMKYMDAGITAVLESGAEPTSALFAGLIVYGEFPSLIGLAGMIITVIALMILAGDKEGKGGPKDAGDKGDAKCTGNTGDKGTVERITS